MYSKKNTDEKYVQLAHPNLKSIRRRLLAGVSTIIICVAIFFVAVNMKTSSDATTFELRETDATHTSDASEIQATSTLLRKPELSAARKLTSVDMDQESKDTAALEHQASKSTNARDKKRAKKGTGHSKHGKVSLQKIKGNKKYNVHRHDKKSKKSSRDHHHRSKFTTSSTIQDANSTETQAEAQALSGPMHEGPDGHGHDHDGVESRIRFFWGGSDKNSTAAAAAPADDSKAQQNGDDKLKSALSGPMHDGPDGHGHEHGVESRIRFFWGGGNNSTSD
jgi:hypothetical protein